MFCTNRVGQSLRETRGVTSIQCNTEEYILPKASPVASFPLCNVFSNHLSILVACFELTWKKQKGIRQIWVSGLKKSGDEETPLSLREQSL